MADIKQKTKQTNTFRYKTFADRVNEIDIRRLALYHIGHANEELPEEDETYFHQTLKKWVVLNLSEEFTRFSKKCMRIVTLPQLVHQKDFVIDTLLECLSIATNLSLQPLLELLYVLARDLREEFYSYFQRVLDRLICLLNTQDAEQLEWTLVCLAFLFKALKPFLKRNIGMVFNAILPLLDEQRYKEELTNFAVECFSFIARDVRDYKKFVDIILDTVVQEQVDSVQGCGRLMFEIMRGVSGLFHSNAGEFLQFMFESVLDESRKSREKCELLQDIVQHAVQHLLQFIHPSNMSLFWQKLCDASQSLKKGSTKFSNILEIFILAAEYRDGRYLSELDLIVPAILKMLDYCMEENNEEALMLIVSLVAKILLSNSTQVTQLDTSRLLKKVLTVKSRKIYGQFIRLIKDHAQFELLVLPALMAHFEQHFDKEAMELLGHVVQSKKPLAGNALAQEEWKPYPLQVKQAESLKKILAKLSKFNDSSKDEEELILLLLLAPHLTGLDVEHLKSILKKATENELSQLTPQADRAASEKRLNKLSLLLETQTRLKFKLPTDLVEQCLRTLLPFSQYLQALGCIDQLVDQYTKVASNVDLSSHLAPLLSHHNHQVRLMVAHTLQTVHKPTAAKSPYHIFYQAECIEPSVHTYREQLLLLQKLETAGEFFKSFESEECKKDALRFLLGMLYHNFKFVWEPVQHLVEEYAKALSPQDFWDIYKHKLEDVAERIAALRQKGDADAASEEPEQLWLSEDLNDILGSCPQAELSLQDLMNYRNLLWMPLPKFGKVIEMKNIDLVRLFLQFVNEEYRNNLERQEYTWDLSGKTAEDIDNHEEDEQENDDEEGGEKTVRKTSKRKQKQNPLVKHTLQTLQSKMSMFAVYPNPRALNREKELYAFYMDLLASANPLLQKLALDCVSSYKHKAVTPYKDHLYAIVDEKRFKDELINFKLDSVDSAHREDFMRILLPVMYGKLMTKGTQRHCSGQVRKSIVLRFLGQCTTDEILGFLQMAFRRYEKYSTKEMQLERIPREMHEDFQLSAVFSPRKLQSMINLLELVRKEFGGLMAEDFQVYMLKLLVLVGSVCNEVLASDSSVMHAKMPAVYRNVRNAALTSLVNFFGHIDSYPWQLSEIQCLTEVFVRPFIERMPADSIHSPTPLLKLLLQWGEKPQRYEYFNQTKDEKGPVIFHYIIELLLSEKAKIVVRRPIMGLIEKLLVSANSEEVIESAVALSVVGPFIPQILKRLRMNFGARSKKQAIDKRDLNILSLLTRHVTEASTCDSLLQLLLPILIAKTQTSTGEEVVCQVITTLSNLIKRLPEPEVYLRRIAPLFAYVQEVQARKMLCDLVGDIAKLRHKQQHQADEKLLERLKLTGRLVFMLNAWDRRWVEQPDYDKRLGALKEISQLLTEDGVDMDLGALIIYNCFYFLKYDKDMGLRDNASEHLQLLLPKLVAKYSGDKAELDYLVDDVFMGLMKRVIRDANDNVRHEAIRLLGVMARECSESHPVLRDLKPLGDAQDAEVDFFENITHLQSHRHGRALLKFCTHAESLKQTPSSRTLTQFILPLASRYLLQEKFAAKHTLIDAAIEAVGVCCQLLPWQNYHSSLRFYLMKMRTVGQEFQKQAVRIVVRVLDAFHFDLSQAHQDQEVMQRMKRELTEKMQKQEEEETKQAERLKKDAEVKAEKVKKEDDDEKDEEDEDEDDEDSEIKEEEDEEEESETETEDVRPECLVLKSLQLLSPNAARRVMHTITSVLIPTLNRSITEKSSYDTKHKVNRKRFSSEREEEEILRVPIALAMVKLMQKLPKELLDSSVSGVFMKVCTFLRSPLKSVRMLTRDILKKIMLALGASYLATLMDHLQTLLTHGFQVHVLSVTVHGVLDALRENLQPADIESCMGNLLDVALNDIFGDITAEKAVEKITAHTPEAKPSAKSYLVLHIVARNIQEKCLLDLLMPFKEHLARSHSRKLTLKIQDCFAKIVGGLVENPHISRESLLIFIYGTMSESITDLLPGTQKRVLTDQEKEKMRRARPDCYIIQAAPRNRVGAVGRNVKTNAQANAHILIEFGLEMLHIVLKRKKLADVNYPPFLNPILPLLRDSLKSTHIRVTTFALKCFASIWNEGYELPALDEYLGDVVPRLFEILKNFSTFGATKQEENMQLVKSVFKAIVALLRKCTTYELTEEQIDQLVLHIEQDIFEGESQAMSFTLLKALLVRKVHSKALFKVMRKISELSIVSPSDFVRDEARALNAIYVVEYPLKKRIDQVVKFYTVHLCYSVPTGRRSAIAFLETLIKKFPFRMLKRRSEFLYLSLGTRLVNDEDSDCRKAVAECLELLITRVGKEGSRELFDMTLLFFDETNKPSVREMAAALCSRFLNAEKKAFADRVKILLPLLVARLTLSNPRAPGRFVKAPGVMAKPIEESEEGPEKPAKKKSKKSDLTEELVGQEDTEEALASKQRELDHEIIQMQYCLLKMLEYCPEEMLLSQNDEINSLIDELAYESQRLLAHDHSWVRCNAAKIIGHIVARYDYELIGRRLAKVDTESSNTRLPDFIYLNPEYDIKSLVLDLCAQVIPGDTPQMMIDEIVKIFLFVANMLRDVPFTVKRESEEEKENEEGDEKTTVVTKINLNWLMHNIKYLINKEMARAPHCTVMRSALFTLIEGLITLLSVESLEKLAQSFLMCLVREMSEDDQNVDKDLRQLALHVGSRLRKRIGADMYDKLRTSAQTKLMMRRAERKKTIAQEKIHDPVKAAKRKVGIQERKKAAKKRKTEIWRGKAEDVKQKLKKRKRKADDDGF